MKNTILSAILMATILVSCNQKTKEETATVPEVQTEAPAKTAPDNSTQDANGFDAIVTAYLDLKNELTKDDSGAAAEKGKVLLASLNGFDTKTLDAKQQKGYADIADDAKENAEHIGDNAGKIDHQREHFVLLSKDMNDLIALIGTKQRLYQDYCPMADEGKGAIWISETKEIRNPYEGSKMLSCGSVKKEL